MKYSKVFNNAKWIIICRIAQSVIQLIIGMISARYLGPSNYGIIGYANSVVGFALPIMQLGLNATLVNELVKRPEKEGEIMGTSLAMSLSSAAVCFVGVFSFVGIANLGEKETIIVCVLTAVSLFFRALELFQYWFHYKLNSKASSVITLIAYVVVSLYKIYLLASGKSIYWFAVISALDYGIMGIAMFFMYFKQNGQRLSFSFDMVKLLFSSSRYYILSAMMVTIFQNTDHVMLKTMLPDGDRQNGFYQAAITCTIVCQFLYTAVTDSMRPLILENKQQGHPDYEKNVSRLYSITIYMALLQGIGFTIFAELIVKILYGADYIATVPVLRILIWYLSFSEMGVVRNIWILAEDKKKIVWKLNLTGALFNVALNAVLIPYFGACGAAAASLATQIFTNFVLGFIVKPLRPNTKLLLKALNPKLIFEMLGMLKKRKV